MWDGIYSLNIPKIIDDKKQQNTEIDFNTCIEFFITQAEVKELQLQK